MQEFNENFITGYGKRNYFVDESGDPVLFNSEGNLIIGQPGCSRFFILGLLDLRDLVDFNKDIKTLHDEICRDSYFSKVPSMQPTQNKTSIFFHAKDDIPEIREKVFKLLMRHELRFYAVVRDKKAVATYVMQRNQQEPNFRYNQNELYDGLIRRLFSGRLHQNEKYHICFARRGTTSRTEALRLALLAAKDDFEKYRKIIQSQPVNIEITPASSRMVFALQATDYFLWALQRLYERNENRYWDFLWPKVKCVVDLDDTTKHKGGMIYTQNDPLTGMIKK